MDKISHQIVPIFFLTITIAAIATGAFFVKDSLGEVLPAAEVSPAPVAVINPQPVKTIVTVVRPGAPVAAPEVKSATQIAPTSTPLPASSTPANTSTPLPAYSSAYNVPEPARYIALGGSSTTTNYNNVPNAAASTYKTPVANSTNTSTSASASTDQGSPNNQSPTTSAATTGNTTTTSKTVTTNGNGSQTITLTSPNGNVVGSITASQSSSGGDNPSGVIDLSASVSQ